MDSRQRNRRKHGKLIGTNQKESQTDEATTVKEGEGNEAATVKVGEVNEAAPVKEGEVSETAAHWESHEARGYGGNYIIV